MALDKTSKAVKVKSDYIIALEKLCAKAFAQVEKKCKGDYLSPFDADVKERLHALVQAEIRLLSIKANAQGISEFDKKLLQNTANAFVKRLAVWDANEFGTLPYFGTKDGKIIEKPTTSYYSLIREARETYLTQLKARFNSQALEQELANRKAAQVAKGKVLDILIEYALANHPNKRLYERIGEKFTKELLKLSFFNDTTKAKDEDYLNLLYSWAKQNGFSTDKANEIKAQLDKANEQLANSDTDAE